MQIETTNQSLSESDNDGFSFQFPRWSGRGGLGGVKSRGRLGLQSKFKLVISHPESESLVTQLGFGGWGVAWMHDLSFAGREAWGEKMKEPLEPA